MESTLDQLDEPSKRALLEVIQKNKLPYLKNCNKHNVWCGNVLQCLSFPSPFYQLKILIGDQKESCFDFRWNCWIFSFKFILVFFFSIQFKERIQDCMSKMWDTRDEHLLKWLIGKHQNSHPHYVHTILIALIATWLARHFSVTEAEKMLRAVSKAMFKNCS